MINVDKIKKLNALPETGDHYICQVLDDETGLINTDMLDWEHMKMWLTEHALKVPQPKVKVTNERTGEAI